MTEFVGRTAVVTGGGSGMGRELEVTPRGGLPFKTWPDPGDRFRNHP